MQTWLICLTAIGSNQSGLWTQTGTWQGANIPTISDQVTINTGHTVTIPNGQTMQAGTLFNQGVLQNFGTLQMGTLVGNVSGTLQSVDYSYHIRGGLRGINLDASGNLTNKLFSMKLGYEETGYYDGNIGKQEWKSSLDGLTRSYTYNYDGANRILSGTYAGGKPNENYSLNSVVYDGNGNIVSLSRNGFKSNNTFGLVDNLNYNYPNGSNKIQAVTDISNEIASFTDVAGSTDYTYYPDGSLKSDANKGITLIEYNYLKLPKRIVKGSTTILYQHDATGRKLKETIGTNVTDYVGNLIYKNNVLYQLGHDEGRIVDGQYEYNIKDHLGNLRVAFRDSSGIAKIVQANSYGVWGEDLPTLSYLKSSWKVDNFKFTGKEELPETGYTDFGARLYDKLVPRFITVDPLAEKMSNVSPYVFCLNNPINMFDSDGKYPYPVYIRSFIATSSVAGGTFRGDGRGASTSTNGVTSRVTQRYVVDSQKGTVNGKSTISDFTLAYAYPNGASPSGIGPVVDQAKPTRSYSATNSKNSVGDNITTVSSNYTAKDPITPQLVTPQIDMHPIVSISENNKTGTVSVSASILGDSYPSTEAFMQDASGKNGIFIGVSMEQGGLPDLAGDNRNTLINTSFQITTDGKGNFTGVKQGDKTYTISDWNKQFTKPKK